MSLAKTILNIFTLLLLSLALSPEAMAGRQAITICLNGIWDMGTDRHYTKKVIVPGIHTDGDKINLHKLWYRKEVQLPEGNWEYATLELKGARFAPEVLVNGASVSKQNGGMAPTFHLLKQRDVKPGRKIILEIALTSLNDLPETDASYIPRADQWRSNVSSCLWNDVVLKLHGSRRIDRIIPFIDYNSQKAVIKFDVTTFGMPGTTPIKGRVEIYDRAGTRMLCKEGQVTGNTNRITISYGKILKPWSPEHPSLYILKLSLITEKDTIDQSVISFGVKDFRIINKQFFLNNHRITLLGGTVVWHRWMRDKEGPQLGYDSTWFVENVVKRLKDHGANYLRFHLGMPPEFFLDLCDRYGLAVQFEWSFFHGMPATKESLLEQFPAWLDVAMRHPSVLLYHPYNETAGEQLQTIWEALDSILKSYPCLVMEDRDVIHIHKYWWGLFENLGLYYDSAAQFPKTIMVDEFGGNYLDGEGMMGEYPAVPEAYLRFLGRNHTRESRLAFHAMANAKIAEYWRRTGAAGVAPFCILGSRNDGNHWFMGSLYNPVSKPVWDELTCAWSPRSVSVELWDRNFTPDQIIRIPVYLFNDTQEQNNFIVRLRLTDQRGNIVYDRINDYKNIGAYTSQIILDSVAMPSLSGYYILSAELMNRPATVKYPVISKWGIHVYKATVPQLLLEPDISVASDESEIIRFLIERHIRNVPLSDTTASLILLSREAWERIAVTDQDLLSRMEKAIARGTSIVLLDAGDRYLGQGYPRNKSDLGPLQGVVVKTDTPVNTYDLFYGIKLSFNEIAEPESHIHPDKNNAKLWDHIPQDHTWLWNGLRGGLIAPATRMEITGLSSAAYLAQWAARGMEEEKIRNEHYFAYELQGYYEYSSDPDDKAVRNKLNNKLTLLVEDAPSLANSMNPNAPVTVTDISKNYKDSANGKGTRLIPLVNTGKNLTLAPVVLIEFGQNEGKLIVSQLLTKGRLAKGYGEAGLYGIRYDEVAVQMVLNMMNIILNKME